MKCPKCKSNMQVVEYDGIKVDRCMDCSGIWFDSSEHERLKALDGSEAIDIGTAKVGHLYDGLAHSACPVCDTPMQRIADTDQQHLRYESCPNCRGVFFDAGEFRDYKDKTFLDFFRSVFRRNRP